MLHSTAKYKSGTHVHRFYRDAGCVQTDGILQSQEKQQKQLIIKKIFSFSFAL